MTREKYIPPCFHKTVTQADHIQASEEEVKEIHEYRNQRAAVDEHTTYLALNYQRQNIEFFPVPFW